MATVAGELRAPRSRPRPAKLIALRLAVTVARLLPFAVGMVAWAVSLPHIHVQSLGEYGLPPALPPLWYAGAGLLVVGAALQVALSPRSDAITLLYVVGLVVVLFGTVPAVSAEPHYAWVYKHVGVSRFLGVNHSPDLSADIYNRWPGFFALTAVFSHLTGVSNPVVYAAWAEVFFALLQAFLIRAAVRMWVEQDGVADGAALLFLLANWVAQGYFSPQALDFTLTLAIAALMLALGGRQTGAARRAGGLLRRVFRAPSQLPLTALGTTRARGALIAAILVLDAASIPTHQLSPYVVLLQTAGLALFGFLRPRWILLPMLAMTVAYLAPNIGYIQHNFGIFSSLDPFSNAERKTAYIQSPVAGKLFNQRAGMLLSLLVWGGAFFAFVRLTRRGLARRALPFALLAAGPFCLLFGQNYGGEAVLRVLLFSLPWCAALIAWALATIERPVRRALAALAVCGVAAALFVPAFYGQEELNQMPTNEVNASEYFDARAQAGSALLFSAPNFPGDYGPRYPLMRGAGRAEPPTLLYSNRFRNRQLGRADVPAVVASILHYAPGGYIVFSTTQNEYAHVFQLVPDGALENLEKAVADSRHFRLFYGNKDARIYQLVRGFR
jgi:hypothetical protein